jgi:predicted nucleic acid-binding protein
MWQSNPDTPESRDLPIELGALGEFIGSFGVIATLIYLAIQIRANTRTTRAEASFNALHSWAQLNETYAVQAEDFHDLILRASKPDAKEEDFTDPEWHRVTLCFRAVMQKLEGQYYLYKYGLKPILTFSDEFVRAVEAASSLDVAGDTIFRKPSTAG